MAVFVPAIVVVVLALVVFVATLSDAGAAYTSLLSPDFDLLRAEWPSIVPATPV